MAKATVLMCDLCKAWDSDEVKVKTLSIAGPKFEMCTDCRAKVLVYAGVEPDLALRYQRMVDTRDDKAGTWPALSTAEGWTPNGEPELPLDLSESGTASRVAADVGRGGSDVTEQPEDTSGVPGDSGEVTPDTPRKRSPSRGRASKE